MSVYVDPLFETTPVPGRWPYKQACHMTSDSIEELHTFAARLGLRRAWFQSRRRIAHCHYDLTAGMRFRAIKLGAKEITREEAAKRLIESPVVQKEAQS